MLSQFKKSFGRIYNVLQPYTKEERMAGEYESAIMKYGAGTVKCKLACHLIRSKYVKLNV